MNTRRPTRTRVRTAVVTTTVTTAVAAVAAVTALTASTALADPAALDDRTPTCSALLGQVDDWPGTGPDGVQLFPDSYERYLLSQPACATPSA
ncbi:hypothetical protein SAMN04488107_0388 [Geodermatophilus saharensis]|uniref:Secreted protein n=1 Tax=Geodermatophilus saharensis TaxID=1137994 RepID=A0A238ZXH9_9ACTN|nr:hypothetical protein [Geodermatophilus saharensis]SNR87598.1 hypothetical protein SAMN04488107_0388 [Geodermatophilus saharensis]